MLTSEEIHPDHQGPGKDPFKHSLSRIGRLTGAVRWEGVGVILYGDNANLAIVPLASGILRIKVFFGENAPDLGTTPAILPLTKSGDIVLSEDEDAYTIASPGLRAVAVKSPFGLKIHDDRGGLLANLLGLEWNEKRAQTALLAMDDQSHFYGLGEKTGFLDKKGERYEMWNSDVYAPHVPDIEALYQSIPWSIHFRYGRPAYGVLLDNPGRTAFDMRTRADRYQISAEKGALDLYVVQGPTLKDVVRNLTALTGRTPLPPKWSIGYQQSRYSYMSQDEVLQVARTFRKKKIPCDVLYLDIHYMDEYRVFTWDPVAFPRPLEMMSELEALGFQLVPIVDPGVKKDPSYPVYQQGVRNEYFCRKLEGEIFIGPVWPGPSAFPDFTDDSAAAWWGNLHVHYTSHGIKGIWNDMNEPSVFNDSKTMDLDVVHANNGNPRTHGELHNLYGMLMSKATQEGMKRHLNGERPFVLTRAGYTGIQRYATVWTGDNRAYWEHLAMSIPMVLNLGLSGVAFAGPDIGGFSHHTTGELLARWTQVGAFTPFCRNHSAIDTIRQEPWLFGEKVEDICRAYIGLRYRLMPTLYALFYETSVSGLPIVRPLLMEYPDDETVYNLCDQFLFGPDLLVAPILRPGTFSRAVYLPAGIWYDYWTGERHEGGRWILAAAPLATMPMYVRAGGILAEQPLAMYADDAAAQSEPVTLTVYAGEEGQFRLYEDDGRTYAYEQGAYRLREFNWSEQTGAGTTLRCELAHDGLPHDREAEETGTAEASQTLRIVVRQMPSAPTEAIASGASLREWTYDAEARQLHAVVEGATDSFDLRFF
ncbi:TIM-barrel domain-containing protein [Cohnella sp. GCM10020058]|uniref:glycoside hydrolase family 31 protein n=1 Tax=Cohnella sp. GCM10020058 TaxID=3317330 RepID=UPI00363696FB